MFLKKKSFAFIFLLGLASPAVAKINIKLKQTLDSLLVSDQTYRQLSEMASGNPLKKDSLAKVFHIAADSLDDFLWTAQNSQDSINLDRVEQINKEFGYPGKTLVGSPANVAAYYVIQHSSKIDKYFPVIKRAAQKGELPFLLSAMMEDRMLSDHGKEQIYGTQAKGFFKEDSTTHKKELIRFIWPIKNAAHINELRKKVGFTTSEEVYAKEDLGMEYTVVTIAEVRAKYPWLMGGK